MPKYLLIAEKPDLMRKIQEIYEKHRSEIPYEIVFQAQRGHLVTLKTPDEIDETQKTWLWDSLPFNPEEHGGWQYKIIKEKKQGSFLTAEERYKEIKKWLQNSQIDAVIHAGDPDQEGELLVHLVLKLAGNKLPVFRFWTNDLTEKQILNALQHLKDDEHDPMLRNLLAAAYGRQHSDYRFGMNISRAATLQMNGRVACGRVKTPILAIVCRREDEIENFKPHTIYGVKAHYEEGFTGTLFDKSHTSDEEEQDEDKKNGIIWFETKEEADNLIHTLSDRAIVISADEKEEKTYAPKLFKLATAQIEAGKMGYNDGDTLRIIQSLYEKKLISYPRTDCEYLASGEDFIGIIKAVRDIPEFTPFITGISTADIERVRHSKKWINDKALEESGHSALRPTTEVANLASLSPEEQEIYKMITRRFLAIFLPPLIQMRGKIEASISDHFFVSTGRRIVDEGYTRIFGTSFTDNLLPSHTANDVLMVKEYEVSEKTSQCPKRYTSPDIIAICENPAKFLEDKELKTSLGKRLKLGTPATRSGIIEQLIQKDHYLAVAKDGKRNVIIPTELGRKIIQNLGSCDICKIDMTGQWEEALEEVRVGKRSLDDLEQGMMRHVRDMIQDIKATKMVPFERKTFKTVAECPKCGNEIIESEKGFSCRGYKKDGTGCNIKMWKMKFGRTFTIDDATILWKGHTITVPVTIPPKTWKQELIYDFDINDVVFLESNTHNLCACPVCNGQLMVSEHIYRCEHKDFSGARMICGATLTDDQLVKLFSGEIVTATCQKDDRNWDQKLYFDKKMKRISFYLGTDAEYKCPCCKKSKLKKNEKGYACPECHFRFWTTLLSHTFTKEETDAFMKGEQLPTIEFISEKTQRPFFASIKLDKKKKGFRFIMSNENDE